MQESSTRSGLSAMQRQKQDVFCPGGNWLLAAEMSLEPAPPFTAFAKHRPPEASEDQKTKIMDSRWISLLMHRIREREAYTEAKKKLGGAGWRPPGGGDNEAPQGGKGAGSKKKGGKGDGKEKTES